MPLLTVTNLTTSLLTLQDAAGLISLSVPGSTTVTDKVVSDDEFAALEPQLKAQVIATNITWSVKDNPNSLADDVPMNVTTVLVTPHAAVPDAQLLVTDLTVPGAVAVNLPAAAPIGHMVVVIDGKGDAAANNVTIAAVGGTINGGASVAINVNRGMAFLYKTGATVWKSVLSSTVGAGAAGGDLAGTYPNPTLGAAASAAIAGAPTFVVGAQVGTTRTVTITLKDVHGLALAAAAKATVWLSDTAGAAPSAVPPADGVTVSAGVLLAALTADVLFEIVSTGAGSIAVVLDDATPATTVTWFVNVAIGTMVASSAAVAITNA